MESRGGYSNNGGYGAGGFNNNNRNNGNRNGAFYTAPVVPAVNAAPQELVPFNKNFYQENESISSLTRQEVEEIRKTHQIHIMTEGSVPNPVQKFEDLRCLPESIRKEFIHAGFSAPSSIQCQGWPIALSGRDLIGVAETGSGKTLAFLVPAIVHIQAQPRIRPGQDGPICLILAPTRELVEQINQECAKFAAKCGMRHAVAYGGVPRRNQQYLLRRGCEILAACPGRLIDFIERRDVLMNRVTFLTLDEADRMLDMGFEPQIRKIVSQVRSDRQTIMYSATWPKEVQSLARDLCCEDSVRIVIGSVDLKASHNVQQKVFCLSANDKYGRFVSVLKGVMDGADATVPEKPRTLVFVETKKNADHLVHRLRGEGCSALSIHGDKDQSERTWVLEEFRQGRAPIVIATDVASRGLDIKNVKFVVNYDMPNQIEDYVHRIGRTGRAGAKGESISFFTPEDARLAKDLVGILQEAKQEVPAELFQFCNYGGGGQNSFRNNRWGGGGGRNSNHSRGGGGGSSWFGRGPQPYGKFNGSASSWSSQSTAASSTTTAAAGTAGNSSRGRW